MRIALVEPEIPQNTGNVARTCAAIGASLDLVRPLGFDISERAVRRAGLDYWHLLDVTVHDSFNALCQTCDPDHLILFTSKGSVPFTDITYTPNSILVFGSETKGLSDVVRQTPRVRLARIPTTAEARCLNLSNAVAVAAYEAMRQCGFHGLQMSRGQ